MARQLQAQEHEALLVAQCRQGAASRTPPKSPQKSPQKPHTHRWIWDWIKSGTHDTILALGDMFSPSAHTENAEYVDKDHQRLQVRLAFYGLQERMVKGDGVLAPWLQPHTPFRPPSVRNVPPPPPSPEQHHCQSDIRSCFRNFLNR